MNSICYCCSVCHLHDDHCVKCGNGFRIDEQDLKTSIDSNNKDLLARFNDFFNSYYLMRIKYCEHKRNKNNTLQLQSRY
jgi:hypothetical protein